MIRVLYLEIVELGFEFCGVLVFDMECRFSIVGFGVIVFVVGLGWGCWDGVFFFEIVLF